MVRHHIKNRKGGNASKKQQKEKEQLVSELKNLDRFAGSSDEESDDGDRLNSQHDGNGESSDSEGDASDNDYEEEEEGIAEEAMKDGAEEQDAAIKRSHRSKKISQPEEGDNGSDEDSDSNNDYKDAERSIDNDDFQHQDNTSKSSGMSNAMARILGGASMLESSKQSKATTNAHVVLSKTTTPLQRLQQKIKNEEAALRQKRRERRSENLSAMRLPLAPTAGMSAEKLKKQKSKKKGSESESSLSANAIAIANEIEAERTHRRIATRGVVALFNAISKHRQQVAAEAVAKEEEKARILEEGRASVKRKSGEGATQTTKHGFLDMIKSAAAAAPRGGGAAGDGGSNRVDVTKGNAKGEGKAEKSVGWNALKDDFMMNSKLKDWDKELSDDDDDEEDKVAPPQKRLKA